MTPVINKTMDRADLLSAEAQPVIEQLNHLIRAMYARQAYMTSWYGTLPQRRGLAGFIRRLKLALGHDGAEAIGMANRGPAYEPLPGAADDGRVPWYLYWEIYWVLAHGPRITSNMRMLDAGGTCSLFTCYLGSLGCEVHSVDINPQLVAHGNRIAHTMQWNVSSYAMDMSKLDFADEYFDHAYSICVFEHLDYEIKRQALAEMARCLKPGGVLSITFDYRNPAPCVEGRGADSREKNQLRSERDIHRAFLSTDHFEILANQDFVDNGKSYLVHPGHGNAPYTFGAIFLRKKARSS